MAFFLDSGYPPAADFGMTDLALHPKYRFFQQPPGSKHLYHLAMNFKLPTQMYNERSPMREE
jgi:hypothetical protein